MGYVVEERKKTNESFVARFMSLKIDERLFPSFVIEYRLTFISPYVIEYL